MTDMLFRISLMLSVIVFISCKNDNSDEIRIPDHIDPDGNFTIYDPRGQPVDTVELAKKTVFESNEEVFIPGYISQLAIDKFGRVFIGAGRPGVVGVFVFAPDGSYITTIGSFGRGPGEYESITSVGTTEDHIYLFDPRLQKFGIFSLEDFSHIEDRIIKRYERSEDEMLLSMRGAQLTPVDDENLILKLWAFPRNRESDVPWILYNRLSENSSLSDESILKVDRFPFYFLNDMGTDWPFTMPFTRHSLVSISEKGEFLTAWSEDFLIKKYDSEGNFERAFYYPMENSNLKFDDLGVIEAQKRALRQSDVPETWPALHTMKLDDEGRLWVATITDDDDSFLWWVLNATGELVARFRFPGSRSSRFVASDPLMKIKNGYFYHHEFDFHEEIDRIVKYEIKFRRQL